MQNVQCKLSYGDVWREGLLQSLGAIGQKRPLLPRDVRTYGMDRTDESDDLVDMRVRRKRKTIVKIGRVAEFEVFYM